MTDAYAKEFEKWLESKGDESTEEDTEGEEENRDEEFSVDEDECDNNYHPTVLRQKSKRDKMEKTKSDPQNDLAPILLDDDDDEDGMFPKEMHHFEDEPPVLEPAPQVQTPKISTLVNPKFPPQNYMRNYSRKSSLREDDEKGFLKTYSKDKTKLSQQNPDSYIHNHSSKLKEKGNGNIFDKFTKEKLEDTPPPLIPSPEAMWLDSESPNSEVKHPSHSPDFCAMEADSTSEILGGKAGVVACSRRLSKNSAHGDVSIECDSTCMLGSSPAIVSPASVSNGESDDVRDSGGGGDGEGEPSDDSSKKYLGSSEVKTENDDQIGSAVAANKSVIVSDKLKGVFKSTSDTQEEHSPLSGNVHNDTVLSEPITAEIKPSDEFKAFLVPVKTEVDTQGACGFPNEPPILPVMSESSKRRHRSRRKRHTIDNPETLSRSGKRLRSESSTCADADMDCKPPLFDISSPPTLTHISETVITLTSRNKCSKGVTPDHKKGCYGCIKDNSPHRKRRRHRCHTLPCSDVRKYVNDLPEDLRSYVVSALELSQLQSGMHKLLYQLFPQLRTDLDSMSPESSRFENLLSELVISLEQPEDDMEEEDDDNNAAPPPLIHMKGISETESQQTNICCHVSHRKLEKATSLPSASDSQAAVVHALDNHRDSVHPGQAPSTSLLLSSSSSSGPTNPDNTERYHLRNHCQVKQEPGTAPDLKDNEPLLPQLSQLTLKDLEESMKPSRVLLYKDPESVLDHLAQLSCRALQLLLPDLTVSLSNELAQSPHDLVIFIENVMLSNSRRKSNFH